MTSPTIAGPLGGASSALNGFKKCAQMLISVVGPATQTHESNRVSELESRVSPVVRSRQSQVPSNQYRPHARQTSYRGAHNCCRSPARGCDTPGSCIGCASGRECLIFDPAPNATYYNASSRTSSMTTADVFQRTAHVLINVLRSLLRLVIHRIAVQSRHGGHHQSVQRGRVCSGVSRPPSL